MKILAIADDDLLVGTLPPGETEVLVCLGDLAESTLSMAFERYAPKMASGVKGNHDSAAPFPDFIRPLHLKLEIHQGVRFGGFGGSWKYKPKGHHLYEQEEVARLLKNFPRVDVSSPTIHPPDAMRGIRTSIKVSRPSRTIS